MAAWARMTATSYLPRRALCGKSVRRLSQELRFQPDIIKLIKSKVSDPVSSQAQLLKILPMSMPIRLEGETEESIPTGREEGTEPVVDEMVHEHVQIVPADSMEIDNGAEELGDAMVTGFARAAGAHEDEPPTSRPRIAHVESSELKEPVFRNEQSIKETRQSHIK